MAARSSVQKPKPKCCGQTGFSSNRSCQFSAQIWPNSSFKMDTLFCKVCSPHPRLSIVYLSTYENAVVHFHEHQTHIEFYPSVLSLRKINYEAKGKGTNS
ncbi:unnamed protein product [Victoria cruziana]